MQHLCKTSAYTKAHHEPDFGSLMQRGQHIMHQRNQAEARLQVERRCAQCGCQGRRAAGGARPPPVQLCCGIRRHKQVLREKPLLSLGCEQVWSFEI